MVLVYEARRETSESDAVERVEPQPVRPLDEVDRVRLEGVLVRRAIQGDSGAVAKLYESHFEFVYGYFCRRIRSISATEDLTSETFTRAVEALSRGLYEWRGKPFRAWLLGIARKVFHEWIRDSKTRSSTERLDDLVARGDLVGEEPDLLDSLVQREERTALWQLVRKLPMEQQRLVILRYAYGLSYAEIAQRLDRSENACKQLHYRALQRLKREARESQV